MRTMKKALSLIGILLAVCIIAAGCGVNPKPPEEQKESISASSDLKPSEEQAESGTASSEKFTQIIENARVSYLGPAGTYTEEATQLFFRDGAAFLPEATVLEAIADVVDGAADYAVIPQENTIGGAVTNYVDAVILMSNIFVAGEVILPINQTLMGVPGASLEDIRLVCSHAQGLAQSDEWRKEHLPNAETKEMDSTAAAADYVAKTGDKSIAAVAAPGAAKLYGLTVLAENVQITDLNKTRFYVLSDVCPEPEGQTHAVLVARCEANRIDDILMELRDAGLELVTLHDRPAGTYLGAYYYLLEVTCDSGITEKQRKVFESIPEVSFRGCFDVKE